MLSLPECYFLSSFLTLFLANKKIFVLQFSFLISYLFLSFPAYSFFRFVFRTLFYFSTILSKIAEENCLILGGNLGCQPLGENPLA